MFAAKVSKIWIFKNLLAVPWGVTNKGFFKGVKDDKFEKDINVLGKEGWEFVGQGLNDGINNNYLIFKRPLD